MKKCNGRSNGNVIMLPSLTFIPSSDSEPVLPSSSPITAMPEQVKTFKKTIAPSKILPSFYIGDDDLDAFLEAGMSTLVQNPAKSHGNMPCMLIRLSNYQCQWRP